MNVTEYHTAPNDRAVRMGKKMVAEHPELRNPYDRRPKPSRFHLLFPKDASTYIFDSMTAKYRRTYPTVRR